MCESTSLIECVLPLWPTLQERRDSCAEHDCDWQSLSDPSEITLRVGEVSLEINAIADLQWLKIGFPFTFSLSVLYPLSPFSCLIFPPFYKSYLFSDHVYLSLQHICSSVWGARVIISALWSTFCTHCSYCIPTVFSLPRQAVSLPSHLIPLFFVWSGKICPDLSCYLFSFPIFCYLFVCPYLKTVVQRCY